MRRVLLFTLGALVLFAMVLPERADAIPAFARKYKTSCSTCHYAYPMLNGFGKAFLNNGYRYPGGDLQFAKEEPVSLGSESYKKVWPNAIWPADMPGVPPVSLHAIGRINVYTDVTPDATAKSTFEFPHEVELLLAGTVGENISFFGEVEVENENNETEIAFPFFMQWDFNPRWHIRLGMVSPDPAPNHLRLTRNHYNVSSFRSQNRWRFRDEQTGLELWGAGNGAGGKGGYRFQLGMLNGQGINDLNNEKDIYARFTYKIGGLGEIGGTEGQESEKAEFYVDNNFRLGGYFYKGTASGARPKEDFTIFGGDVDFWWNRLLINGVVLSMNSELKNVAGERKSLVWYAQGNYVLYPWLIALARYEFTDANTDVDTPEAQKSLIPGVVVMLRANVKASVEYLIPLDDPNKKNDQIVFQFNFGF